MKTMKVLILGGEAVGVVDGGCELVEVPVVGGNESELGFKPGFLGAVDSDLGLKGLDHMKVPFEGGVPVTVDYKAEVRAYVDSVPEGGFLIPGWRKVIEEDTVIRAFDSADYGITLYFDDDGDNGEDWYGVYTFLRLDLRSNL